MSNTKRVVHVDKLIEFIDTRRKSEEEFCMMSYMGTGGSSAILFEGYERALQDVVEAIDELSVEIEEKKARKPRVKKVNV